MAMPNGARFGPYEILAPLGAGGMGEVYRASDTRLDREVAIKVLPAEVAGDAERRQRFEREAKAVAALSHPNILAIFDVGVEDGVAFAVMELLEGETLRERLGAGPLPARKAVDIAVQMSRGLAAAHGKHLVHRDLKPENLFLLADGQVKILDFGLARREARCTGETHTAAALTHPGTVMGTVGYMAPEQVRGDPADVRTDLFALGAVLYEMLSGQRAFARDTTAETMTAILRDDPPDLAAIRADLPPALDRIIRHCLEKNPAERFQTARDVAFALEALSGSGASSAVGRVPFVTGRSGRRSWAGYVACVAAGACLTALALKVWPTPANSDPREPAGQARTSIALPDAAPLPIGGQASPTGFDGSFVAASPDGRLVAYIGRTTSGTQVFVRHLSDFAVVPVAGTEDAIHVFFSPDSQWLGFLTDAKVRKVPLSGGTPTTLCDASEPVFGTWIGDAIYFSEAQGSMLSRVDAGSTTGEKTTPVGRSPWFEKISAVLPSGAAALKVRWTHGIGGDYAEIRLASIPAKEDRVLVQSGYDARYVPGYLLFGRAGNLMGVPFDAGRGLVQGDPFLVAAGVGMDSLFGQMQVGVSPAGAVAYAIGGDRAAGRIVRVGRLGPSGAESGAEELNVPTQVYGPLDLSPRGDRLAVHVADVNDFVATYDFARREFRKVAGSERGGWPVWSPDGRRLAYSVESSSGSRRVVSADPDGGPTIDVVSPSKPFENIAPTAWSADGTIALDSYSYRIVLWKNGSTEFISAAEPVSIWGATFSPDGRFVAYSSSESGTSQIYVRPYPGGTRSRQVTTDGGLEPRWCANGELFYRRGNRWMSVAVKTQPELQVGLPALAFKTDFIDTPGRSYAVSPDGRYLYVVKRIGPDVLDRIDIITNWSAPAHRSGEPELRRD